MSLEKEALLRALGAEVIRTPTEAAWDSPTSHIGVAQRLQREIPYGIILDQYSNPNNPLAHELTTGPEIIEAVVATPSSPEHTSSGKVDVLVAGAGTGGTITGIARAIKKTHNRDCIVVGVDPKGSVLAKGLDRDEVSPEDNAPYSVEGIGYDFTPEVLNFQDIDQWMKTGDAESFAAVQLIMRNEGLLVGGSSGSALSGALRWLKSDAGKEIAKTEGADVVVLLADGYSTEMSPLQVLDNALGAVGKTPLIRLDKIAKNQDLKCNLLGKVEFFSAGGSVKDRIAKAMVEAAERDGKLIPGKSVVIEPTSGNTGIGLAMACAIKIRGMQPS